MCILLLSSLLAARAAGKRFGASLASAHTGPAGGRFLFFLTASLETAPMSSFRRKCVPPQQLYVCGIGARALCVCVCVSLARAVSFPVLFFVQSIGARKTFNARWQSASALTGLFRALTGEEGGGCPSFLFHSYRQGRRCYSRAQWVVAAPRARVAAVRNRVLNSGSARGAAGIAGTLLDPRSLSYFLEGELTEK